MPGKPAPFLKIGLSLLIVACAAGCKPPPPPPPAPQPRAVQLFTLDAAAESGFRSFPGEVAAVANLELSFDVGGRLIEFPVYDGMLLEAGQLVGRLEDNDFRAEADSARAQFLTARQEFDRQQQLFNRRVISRSELDRHREAFDIAEARLRTATKALEDTQLLAPFRGRVSHRFVRNFQNVNARQPIILLQDVSRLKVDIQLPEAFMSRLPPEATAAQAAAWIEARAEFAALPGRYFDLALDSFATRANPASRTFLVSFLLTPPEEAGLLPGMTCTVFLRARENGGPEGEPEFLVPAGAVAGAGDAFWVWRWDEATGAVSRVAVEMLGPSGTQFLVRSLQLKPGDQIVAAGVRFLAEGDRVRPASLPRF